MNICNFLNFNFVFKFREIHNLLQCTMKYEKKISLLLSVCLHVYKADVVGFWVFFLDFIYLTYACCNYKLSKYGAFVVCNQVNVSKLKDPPPN